MTTPTLEQIRSVIKEEIKPTKDAVDGLDRTIRGHNGHPGVITDLTLVRKQSDENKERIRRIVDTQDSRRNQLRGMWAGVGIALISVIGKWFTDLTR